MKQAVPHQLSRSQFTLGDGLWTQCGKPHGTRPFAPGGLSAPRQPGAVFGPAAPSPCRVGVRAGCHACGSTACFRWLLCKAHIRA